MSEAIQNIPIAHIRPSPLNPRKHWSEGTVGQLAESIKQVGVQQPIVVRQVDSGYEAVFGHRRLAASLVAGLKEIPSIVRELDDDQVLEIQIIENSQREDVHPLDEADGFRVLVNRGFTPGRIAERIGRSVAHVVQRLKLVDLCKEARDALDKDLITLGAALVIARLPTKVQKEFAEEQLRFDEGTVTAAEAQSEIERNYMRSLNGAAFDTTSETLVPKAGSCNACPKRTGNQTELFEGASSPDLCSDTICFRSKLDAAWKIITKDPGPDVKIMPDAEAKKTIYRYGGVGNGYTELDGNYFDPATGKSPKVATILKRAKAEAPPITIGRNPETGEIVKMVEVAAVRKLLAKDAKAAAPAAPRDDSAKRIREKQILDARVTNACIAAAVANVERESAGEKPDAVVLRLVRASAWRMWSDNQKLICSRRGIEATPRDYGGKDHGDALLKYINQLTPAAVRGMACEIALSTFAPASFGQSDGKDWRAALADFGVDEKAVRKEVMAEATAAKAAKKAAKKKPKVKA